MFDHYLSASFFGRPTIKHLVGVDGFSSILTASSFFLLAVMILPLAKLGTLALKSFCKPIGKRLKKEAGLHPQFRELIINVAQANYRLTTTLQRRIYGRATNVAIRPLNEEKAVQVAADLLGELFLFTVAGVAVILEVQRSSRSEAKKEEKRRQELEAMRQHDEYLAKEVEMLKGRVIELEQVVKNQGGGVSNKHSQGGQDDKVKCP